MARQTAIFAIISSIAVPLGMLHLIAIRTTFILEFQPLLKQVESRMILSSLITVVTILGFKQAPLPGMQGLILDILQTF